MVNLVDLINDDCLKEMDKMIRSGVKVDCVITDPPYKIVAGGIRIIDEGDECSGILRRRDYSKTDPKGVLGRGRKVVRSDGTDCSNKWIKRNGDIPSACKNGKMFKHNDLKFAEWLPKIFELLRDKSHCYIMCNGRNLNELMNESIGAGFKYQNLLAWVKNNATPNKYYMQQMEFILMLRKGGAKNINNMGTKNALHFNNIIGTKVHPTEKPVDMLEVLVGNSSKENDIVLDPFMGSGTTGLACKKLNRNFIGIELDKEYFGIAEQRINEQG